MWHDIDMQWHIALHMNGNIAFHRCECMVEIQHLIWCLMGGLDTVGRSPIESHGCMKWKRKLVSSNSKKG